MTGKGTELMGKEKVEGARTFDAVKLRDT